uniref:hypothetical protein n=1 Tax=Pseudomonas syringae TaxID=317 RepID=UPI001E356BD4|nr:hypothetical protein [Pseudomonas syringae]QOQ33607.1 hypothetical protein [Pseudomonas syringae pv. actinidiae]
MITKDFTFRRLVGSVKLAWTRCVVAAMIAVTPLTGYTNGFPTFDVTAVAQAVADYSNQLLQYTEQMQQTILEESQLAQLVATYEQTMTSYDHMLSQMTGLKNKISRRDWQGIYAKYGNVIDSYPGNMPDFSSGKWIAKGKDLQSLYARIDQARDLEDAIRALPFDAKSEQQATIASEQSFAREQLAVGQSLFVDDMASESEIQMERYGEVAEKRAALGPEDHLKTLQVMAEQNELMIEAAQQQNAINNAQLQYSNQLDAQVFSLQNQGRMASLKEAKARLSDEIVIDNEPLSKY